MRRLVLRSIIHSTDIIGIEMSRVVMMRFVVQRVARLSVRVGLAIRCRSGGEYECLNSATCSASGCGWYVTACTVHTEFPPPPIDTEV